MCRRPRRPTRLGARTPSPPGGGASAAAGELGAALLCRAAPGKGDPGREVGRSGNAPPQCARPNLPRISSPCWRPPASLYSRLPNSWWLLQSRVLNVPPALHPKGLPTQKGPPVVEGCLLALKSRFLNWGEGENQSEWSPEVIALNLQNGLEWVVYSSLQIMLFLILFCLLQPHAPFARSHPD